MAIVFDAAGTSTNGHDHTCSGVGRILFVGVSQNTGTTDVMPSVVEYGGAGLTELARTDRANVLESALWYMVAPTAGPNTITLNSGAAGSQAVVSVSYTGVDKDTPFIGGAYSTSSVTDSNAGGTYASNDAIAHGPDELIITYGATGDQNPSGEISTNTTSRATLNDDNATQAVYTEFADVNSSPSTGVHTFLNVDVTGRGASNIAAVLRQAVAGKTRAVKYFHDIYDPGGRIFDDLGKVVPPWELKPNNWIKVTGLFLPTSKEYSTFVQDPSIAYIEEVSFSARGGLRIKTNRGEMTEVLLARAAGGKTL